MKRDGRKALVITYRPTGNLDIAHKHHAALIEGLEAGFGDSVEIAETVVEVAEMETEEDDEKTNRSAPASLAANRRFNVPRMLTSFDVAGSSTERCTDGRAPKWMT